MVEKLKLVENRFAELSELIIQPDIISDQKKYIQLSKEYKETKKIIDKGEVYKNLIANKSGPNFLGLKVKRIINEPTSA